MYFAHGPISYLINERIQRKNISKLSIHEQSIVLILSMLFGVLPDIDLAILSLTSTPAFQHHLSFTHSALFFIFCWLILNLILWILRKIVNKNGKKALNENLIKVIQYSFILGTLSHLFADILLSYSRTLFPLRHQVTILGGVLKQNLFASYIFTHNFGFELLFTSIFFLVLYKKYIKKSNISRILLYFFISIASIYTIFGIYMNTQTYNMADHFEDGRNIQDQDYDGIHNSSDSDTNNNGINNIEEVNRNKLAKFVKSISIDKYLASYSKDSLEYMFGAFDSYRLISQAYFEQNLPIEPVLKEYANRKYPSKSYTLDINYSTLLKEYLLEKYKMKDLDYTQDVGKIFLVLDQKETLLNMGIVMEQEELGIVLEGDERLKIHSEEDILIRYPNCEIILVDTP